MPGEVTVFNEVVDPADRKWRGYPVTWCEMMRAEWRKRRQSCRDQGYGRPWCLPIQPAYDWIGAAMRKDIKYTLRMRREQESRR